MDRNVEMQTIEIAIPRGRTLRLRGSAGCAVEVSEGTVWITEEGSTVDTTLAAGERGTLSRDGLALIYAFYSAHVSIRAAGDTPPELAIRGGYREYSMMVMRALLADAAASLWKSARRQALRLAAPLVRLQVREGH